MTKKQEQTGLKIINSHRGKKITYETYLDSNPEMADKYLEFIAKNTSAQYISWDIRKSRFVG